MRRDAAIFAGMAVFAAVLAFLFWNQLRASNRLVGELRQQVEELTAARSADLPPAARNMTPQPAVAPVAAPGPPMVAPSPVPANSPAAVASNCDALLATVRRSASNTIAGVAVELNLNPSEVQRITEVRTAQMISPVLARQCASSVGSLASPEELQAQLEALLGPARFEQLQELNASRTTQQNMASFGNQLKESGVPLDEQQARQLTTTIMDESRRWRREVSRTAAPSDPHARLAYEEEILKMTEERVARSMKAAQAYLRPEQLAQLRGNMTRQIDSMRASLNSMRASVEAGRPIPSPQPFGIVNAPGNMPVNVSVR